MGVFVCSVADVGELLQRPLGHPCPGHLHGREASSPGPDHHHGHRSDLQRYLLFSVPDLLQQRFNHAIGCPKSTFQAALLVVHLDQEL